MYEGLDRPLVAHAEAIADQTRRRMELFQEYSDHSQPRADALVRPARERLAQISRLDRDWDSYGAEPLSQKAITRANKLLGSVGGYFADLLGEQIRPYAVAPLASGGVQLQWRGPGGDLEVEVGREGDLGYLLVEGVEPNRTFTEADEVTSSEVLDLLAGVLLS